MIQQKMTVRALHPGAILDRLVYESARFQFKKLSYVIPLTILRPSQPGFRFRLAAWDNFRIISEDEELVAAHIMPRSRPEVCTCCGRRRTLSTDLRNVLVLSRMKMFEDIN